MKTSNEYSEICEIVNAGNEEEKFISRFLLSVIDDIPGAESSLLCFRLRRAEVRMIPIQSMVRGLFEV